MIIKLECTNCGEITKMDILNEVQFILDNGIINEGDTVPCICPECMEEECHGRRKKKETLF